MKPERLHRNLLLLAILSAGLIQYALACHEVSANSKSTAHEPDSRAFLIDLHLNKSGTVHAVQVLTGGGPLRSQAVKEAARRKYKPQPGYNTALITVEVKFPRGQDWRPEIHEAVLGVPSCVYGGAPIQWPLIPWVNKLLSRQPIVPFLLPGTDSDQ